MQVPPLVVDWLTALQDAPFAEALRLSFYAYPIVNAAHILSIGLVVGSILPLDLRVLGLFREVPVDLLTRVLEPVAAIGLALALATGFLLFSVKPLEYVVNPALFIKLGLVVVGTVNAGILFFSPAWRRLRAGAAPTAPVRLGAFLSAVLWISAVFAGRFIAFIHVA